VGGAAMPGVRQHHRARLGFSRPCSSLNIDRIACSPANQRWRTGKEHNSCMRGMPWGVIGRFFAD